MAEHTKQPSGPGWRERRPSASFRPGQLWSGATVREAAAAEEALLAAHVRSPFELGRVFVDLKHIGVPAGNYMATIDINAGASGTPIVLAHGAGAGLGFGYQNFDTYASLGGERRRVLAFDWLGQANSSRPSFPPGPRPAWLYSETELFDTTVRFFVEALEAWRKALGIERFDLIGHSMGGFFSAQYAMRYPQRVRRLVLSGAAGLGARPAPDKVGAPPMKVMKALWDARLLHFGTLGSLGRLVRGGARRGLEGYFRTDGTREAELLSEYWWALLAAHRPSADAATNIILEPLATEDDGMTMFARRPVAAELEAAPERLAALRRVPITCVYGESDWLFTESVHEFVELLGPRAELHFVRHAAHHLYADNRAGYHAVVEKALAGGAEDTSVLRPLSVS